VQGRRPGRLDLQQHVRALVLDRLERSDGPAELHARLPVLHRLLQAGGRAAHLLGGERGDGQIDDPVQVRASVPGRADPNGRGVGERDDTQRTGDVERVQPPPGKTRRPCLDGEEPRPVGRRRHNEEQLGGVAVHHEGLAAGERPALPRRVGRGGGFRERGPVTLAQRHRGGQGPTGDARQPPAHRGLVPARDERLAGQRDRTEERPGQHDPAHLLKDDAEFDHPLGGGRAIDDPAIREAVADFDTKVHILRLLCRKVVADLIAKGGAGPEASIIKLYYSELLQSLMRFGVDIAGPATHRFATKSQVVGWESGAWMLDYLDSWGWTIGGGTNEIQRTVVGERVLGLPREPSST
jgi:hypothetical protein